MNAPLIDLTEEREKRTPHSTGEAVCVNCRHEWVAVAPLGMIWLDCPSCTLNRGRFRYHHKDHHRLHWTCNCGNDLFYVTLDRVYCPNCGLEQKGLQ